MTFMAASCPLLFPARAELAGPPESGSSLPVVDTPDIEAVVAAWTGLPVERMGQDEKEKLVGLVSGGRVGVTGSLIAGSHHSR
jgi:ATP-dependent Clp protease ATP-binding subunit ClpA